MDKQEKNLKDVNIDTLYPDLGERLSVDERKFVAEVKAGQWQEPVASSTSNPYQMPNQNQQQKVIKDSLPLMQLKFHVIRGLQSWQDLVKDTVNWVNKNIHAVRIISISVVLCHSTTAGQCTIFYNDAKDDYMKRKIAPLVQYGLSAGIVNTGKVWDKHHEDVMKTAAQLGASGGVIGISELETNMTHNRATSVIWFLRKY